MADPGARIMRERASQYRQEARRIREWAASVTTPAVRQQLLDKVRQLDGLANGLDEAALKSEQNALGK